MTKNLHHLSHELVSRGIRPSHQRVLIFQYMKEHPCHPTVGDIYNGLKPEIPSLSRATVYNTLASFVDVRLARVIAIEDNEARYDILTHDHGHFKCDACGTIHNFVVDIDGFVVKDLEEFEIEDRNVYFRGICPECQRKRTREKEVSPWPGRRLEN